MPVTEEKRELAAVRQSQSRSGRLLLLLVLAVVLVSAALFFAGWSRQHRITLQVDAAADAARDAAPVVNVVKVAQGPGDVAITLPGNITPVTEAYIYARSAGYVKKRYADFGDRVREGQLLAEIDSPELDSQVVQARAAVTQAESLAAQARAQLENQQAQANLARVTWDRYRNLAARGAIARQDADQQETNFSTSQAGVKAAQSSVAAADENVKAARANVDRLAELQGFEKVYAPFTGVLTARNFDVGALISAAGSTQGMTAGISSGEMFRLARFDVLRILVDVYQEDAPWIKPGQTGDVTVQEFPDRKFAGRITRTANSVNVTSRTMLTEIQISNPDLVLLPGMYAQVRMSRSAAKPALLIPGDTIVTGNHGLQVAILEDVLPVEGQASGARTPGAKRVHFVNVQVGRDDGEQIEVKSGLQGWEYVVVNPGDVVQEGAIVRPVTAAPKQPDRTNGKGLTPRK
ncbi:MAG TPA: efflux RND transporter periplasmic adaptor subunit [Bryobacteraceae bacterium]|jgi:RND family efflux transporter MFP subunit